jgi:Glyoxalase/Bleomycin resistance protein/Dioxygenase superfamily
MTMKITGLDHIQICVPTDQEENAREFYLNILNFEEIEKPDSLKKNGGFWCHAGNAFLHIGVEKFETITSKRHPAFIVEDINETRKHLERHQVPIKEDTLIPGIIRFSCFDPFNNRIELLQRIHD